MKEYRVFGTPGSGKTTRLATRDIPRAVKRFGPDKVMVTSYTKAAAREIAFKRSRSTGTRIDVAEENVGTLHSLMYHALGRPEIAETPKYLAEWNKRYPAHQITGSRNSIDQLFNDELTKNDKGDRLLNAVNILRNQKTPIKLWSHDQNRFYENWHQFKSETGSVDFTDLIEMGIRDFYTAPNDPKVIFVDEAQDSTKLQLDLVRQWADKTEFIIIVGDDDQCLYNFAGSTPDAMLYPEIDDEFKIILKRSYRVPRLILDRALVMIKRVTKREPKEHLPRLEADGSEAKGELLHFPGNYRDALAVIRKAQGYVEQDMTVAILASCSYMLEPVKAQLRKNAIPFHNPYRRRRKDWNPLHGDTILTDFLESGPDENFWTIPQLIKWSKFVKVGENGLIRKTGKKVLQRLEEAVLDNEPRLHSCRNAISMVMTDSAIKAAMARDVDWLIENAMSDKAKSLEYPIQVYKAYGKSGIDDEPKLSIGTIHSTKGATFDVVILFPDISYLADMEMLRPDGRDAVFRMFYVGMTRAKHSLILTNPTVSTKTPIPRMYVPL